MKPIEKVASKAVSQWTIHSKYGWPPECAGFVYQPERPVSNHSSNEQIGKEEIKENH